MFTPTSAFSSHLLQNNIVLYEIKHNSMNIELEFFILKDGLRRNNKIKIQADTPILNQMRSLISLQADSGQFRIGIQRFVPQLYQKTDRQFTFGSRDHQCRRVIQLAGCKKIFCLCFPRVGFFHLINRSLENRRKNRLVLIFCLYIMSQAQ